MKKKNAKKLNLSKDTLSVLDPKSLLEAAGGAQESQRICSIQHTCVSCHATPTETCA